MTDTTMALSEQPEAPTANPSTRQRPVQQADAATERDGYLVPCSGRTVLRVRLFVRSAYAAAGVWYSQRLFALYCAIGSCALACHSSKHRATVKSTTW
jgi:hypothetical protein